MSTAATGGTYHHAADASQLADVFMEFVDTLSVIDMLGRFGPREGVTLVEGIWRDKDDERQRMDIFFGSNQSRSWAEQYARDQCRTFIHAGKPTGTVEVYECNLRVSYCSEDVGR